MGPACDLPVGRPASVVLRYLLSADSSGFMPDTPRIDGEPTALSAPDRPYAELAFALALDGKSICEILHADEELRGKLRLIRLDFVHVLERLGAVTRERALEMVADPLVEPPLRGQRPVQTGRRLSV